MITMKPKLNLMLSLILIVLALAAATQGQSLTNRDEARPVQDDIRTRPRPCAARFFAAGDSGRLHFAFSAPACTDTTADACNTEAADVKKNCEYRHEDGGTAFSSCNCQAVRQGASCYRNAGCETEAAMIEKISAECFIIQ